jgi:putative SOS response-associated peptidase YedK
VGVTSSAEKGSQLAPINARAESIATTAIFRDAFRRRRCLVVADGFYEWRREGRKKKTPFFVRLRSGRPFGFAGLWTWFGTSVGQRMPTCAIVTCPPNEMMARFHDRMPVILPATARDE